MFWGQIQVGYYALVIALALIVNGSPLVAVLAVFLAWGFEPSFKTWVFETFDVKTDEKAAARATVSATSKPKAPAKKATGEAKPKTTSKPRTTKAKPKPVTVDD